MSKINRFSLEERYGYQNRKVIYDKDADNDILLNNIYPIIDLLNQLDEQIADLQRRLEVAERTTKLACDELRNLNYRTFNNRDIDFEQQFKEQAEKELKGEYVWTNLNILKMNLQNF